MTTHSSILAWKISWTEEPEVTKESGMTSQLNNKQFYSPQWFHQFIFPQKEQECSFRSILSLEFIICKFLVMAILISARWYTIAVLIGKSCALKCKEHCCDSHLSTTKTHCSIHFRKSAVPVSRGSDDDGCKFLTCLGLRQHDQESWAIWNHHVSALCQ